MVSKEFSPIISHRVYLFFIHYLWICASFARYVAFILWLIKRHYEIQYLNVICTNGKIAIYFYLACDDVRDAARYIGMGWNYIFRFFVCFLFSLCNENATANGLGKVPEERINTVYSYFLNDDDYDDDDDYYVFLFSSSVNECFPFFTLFYVVWPMKRVDRPVKMLHIVSWKAHETFFVFSSCISFLRWLELNIVSY